MSPALTAEAPPVASGTAAENEAAVANALAGDELENVKPSDASSPQPAKPATAPGDGQQAHAAGDAAKEAQQPPPSGTEAAKAEGDEAQPDAKGDGSEAKPLTQEEIDKAAADALGLHDKGPVNLESVQRRYQESSREVRRKDQRIKAITDRLEKQGLKVVDGKDGEPQFLAIAAHVESKLGEVAPAIFDSLSEADKNLGLDKAKDFVDIIVRKTLEATARPAPTAVKEDIVLDDRLLPVIRQKMIDAKKADGSARYPDYVTLESWMERMLMDEGTPVDFRIFANSSPENREFALRCAYGITHTDVAPLIARQMDTQAQLDKKEKSAQEDASLTSEGTVSAKAKKTGGAVDEAKEIATAEPIW
jgi:hypothetical protein